LQTSWYKFGQTPGSVLGKAASSYEECRAEAVALFLASNKEILKLFKVSMKASLISSTGASSFLISHILSSLYVRSQYESKEDQEDIQQITFLLMARAGVRALEFYNPEGKKHGPFFFLPLCSLSPLLDSTLILLGRSGAKI